MLSNSEFAVISGIDGPLSEGMEEMALFTIDLGDVMAPAGRDENGKRVVKPANPHLVGKGKNLWEVTPLRDTATPGEMRVATKVEAVIQRRELKNQRKANIARYAAIVAAADETDLAYRGVIDGEKVIDWSKSHLFGDAEEPEDTTDGWDKFFADDVPMTGGRCRRRGGVKDHAAFESFVDS